MRKHAAAMALTCAMAALILDSHCAADSAREALELCMNTLIPSLFPLFVISAMLVPGLQGLRIPILPQLLGIPDGSEGIFLLGCAGGFPVGAACIAQAAEDRAIARSDAARMLGLCSFCGPAFLFGVISSVLTVQEALVLFLLQLETALLTGALWRGRSGARYHSTGSSVSLPQAVRRSLGSMASVCGWVILAAVAAGFLRRWLFPLLPTTVGVLMTGLLELTNGIYALDAIGGDLRFLLCAFFACFGGVSVLLQIGGLAARAGLPMGPCIAQKTFQAMLAAALAALYLRFGILALFLPPAVLFAKIAVEISGGVVYNTGRKEGI